MMRRLIPILVVVASMLLLSLSPAPAADPPGFGAEMNLSNAPGRSARPVVATAGDNVYVVWQEALTRPDGSQHFPHIVLRRSTDRGVTFEPVQELDTGTGASLFPFIAAVDSYVYVVWANSPIQGNFPTNEWDVYFSYSDDFGASFSPPVNLSNTKGAVHAPSVVASDSNVYVTWGDHLRDAECASNACNDLLLRASDDYGRIFGPTVKLNRENLAEDYGAYDFAASGNDAYAVWREWDPAGGNDIYLTHISGTSVGDPVAVNDPPGKISATPAVAADGERVYVAWAEDDPGEILLRVGTNHGQTLEPARNVSGNPGGSVYPKLRASAGKVYLAWLDGSFGRADILFTRSVDAGVTFPEPANLSRQFNSLYGSWAWFFSMGASGDQVYIAWPIQSEILLMAGQDGGQNLVNEGDYLLPIVLDEAEGETDTVFRPVVRAGQSGVYAAWDEGDAEVGNGQIWEIPLFGGRNREVMFRAQPGLDPDLILDRVSAVQVVYGQPKLVAGKKTLVQAVITNGFDHEVQTTIKLTYDPGTGTETTVVQPVTLPRGTTTLYLPEDDFLLPSGTTFAAEVAVDPDDTVTESEEDNNYLEYSAMVAATRPFRVLFVPVQIGSDPAVTGPTLARVKEEASSFLQAVLPVAEDDFYSSFSYPSIVRMPAPADGDRLSDTELDNLLIVLDMLAGMAQVDKVVAVTRPYWFRDLAPGNAAGAAGLSAEGFDGVLVDSFGMYDQVTAHEILHTYGWVDSTDPLYLANPAGHMGYYLSPGYRVAARMPLTLSADLMFPNAVPDPWISRNTYDFLFRTFRLNPYDPAVINISGMIFKDGQATLDPWYRLESTLDRELGQPGAYTLAYLNQDGTEIGATGFDVQFDNPYYDAEPTSVDSAPFSLRVPDLPGTARLELRYAGTVLAARDVSPNAPQVHVVSPNGGEIAAPGQPLTVTWDSSDADGGMLTHIVSLSRDGGQTWVPVALGVAGNQASFTPTSSDTTTQALVRVTTTDGINTTEDTSDAPFTIRTGVGSEATLGPTVNVSDTAIPDPVGRSSFKAVSVADRQNLYATWTDAGALYFRRSTDGGASFGTLIELGKTRDVSEAYGTRMAAGGGKVYAAWKGYLPGESYTQSHILFRRSTDGGASFEPAQPLEPVGGTSSEDPQVAASGDNVYVIWFDWGTSNLILRVSHDAGATFGDQLVVGSALPQPSVSGMNAVSPRFVAAGTDVFIVWSSYVDGKTDIFFNRSADAGGTFAGPIKLSSNPSAMQADIEPQLVFADGRLHIAWREVVPTGDASSVNHLFLRNSEDDGASFSPMLDLRPQWPASSPLEYGTLKFFDLTASGSNVYLAWMTGPLWASGGADPNHEQELILLSASHDHGATFAAPIRVEAADPTHLTDSPKVSASANNVYVAWSQLFPIESSGSHTSEERLRRSNDGGVSFGDPFSLATSSLGDAYPFRTLPIIPTGDGARILWQGRNYARAFIDKDIFLRAIHESVSSNQPPDVYAGPDQTVAAGALVTLAGAATDPDGDRMLVSWSQSGGTPVLLGTTDNLALDFRAPEVDAPATLTFQLAASDGLASSTGIVSVTVNPRAPITDFAEANPELWDLMVGSSFPPTLSLPSTPVDTTPPVVTGTPDREPDAGGWYNYPVTITWSGEDDSGPVTCDPPTVYEGPDGGAILIEGTCTDTAGNVGTGSVTLKYDATAPSVNVVVPSEEVAVQDGVTLAASAGDATSGVDDVRLYVREDDGGSGIDVGFEGLQATYNSGTGRWEHWIDTTLLPDGYYVALAKAEDTAGNDGWSDVRHFSIRNDLAVLERLPASESNKAGRTMPVKFSLRIAAAVDPAQPFVYSEDLTIKVYEAGHPDVVLQVSTFGSGAMYYRIDDVGEIYITNFKTLKTPKDYTVDIWRHNTIDFLVGSFGFSTVK